jgi:hypothetical protein
MIVGAGCPLPTPRSVQLDDRGRSKSQVPILIMKGRFFQAGACNWSEQPSHYLMGPDTGPVADVFARGGQREGVRIVPVIYR